jgi:hypothetical protein
MTRFSALLLIAFAGCSAEMKREICGDGIDNDGNGQTDCEDRDCTGQVACIPPDYGNCAKCSQSCTAQATCVTNYLDERPIPLCVAGKCSAVEKFIQPRIEINTLGWQGLAVPPQSGTTRFIKKTANDGSAVTCATVLAVASDRNATAAGAIEASTNLVVQGLDVTRVMNAMLGQRITYTFVNTQTGGDYLIWTELWGGPPSSATKLPTGRRLGYGCYETLPTVAPLVAEDNCPSTTSDAGTCRVFQLAMPPPEMP